MREITEHRTTVVNEKIIVKALDDPGADNASRQYQANWYDGLHALSLDRGARSECVIQFHSGDPSQGVNGITHEVLLAIQLDHLRAWQEGPFKSRENAIIITKLEEALMWLRKRTEDRRTRGVEGKQEA